MLKGTEAAGRAAEVKRLGVEANQLRTTLRQTEAGTFPGKRDVAAGQTFETLAEYLTQQHLRRRHLVLAQMDNSLAGFRSDPVFLRPHLARITWRADWEQPDFIAPADSWAENPAGRRNE